MVGGILTRTKGAEDAEYKIVTFACLVLALGIVSFLFPEATPELHTFHWFGQGRHGG